jgi:chromosome segregation protein
MNAVEMRIAQLEFEKKRAGDTITRANEERAEIDDEQKTLQADIDRENPDLENLRESRNDVERALGGLAHEIEAIELEWSDRSRVVQELGIAVVTARGELQNAQSDQKHAEDAIRDILVSLDRHAEEARAARQEIASTGVSVDDNRSELDRLRIDLGAAEEHRSHVDREAARIREDIHAAEITIKDLRREAEACVGTLHETELRTADLVAKADHLKARAQEEFEHVLELKTYPEDEFVDFAALREEIQRFRDRAKSLGNINFAAFEEYTTEKQRLEFLTSQRNDLLEAERTLLATIEEINATAQKKFLDTFDLIRRNFIATFKSLFDPGDECDLRLEQGVDDPLEAGIEIIAKPRGKRPTSIDLLSGGEKTLTATALLFAIYLVKPSPFCILDEVDAPLDDANIDRFTRILRTFSTNTQFIVVTHNKRTMEAANALYGVTMEEEGVSKIVTVRFNQDARPAAAAVATG